MHDYMAYSSGRPARGMARTKERMPTVPECTGAHSSEGKCANVQGLPEGTSWHTFTLTWVVQRTMTLRPGSQQRQVQQQHLL